MKIINKKHWPLIMTLCLAMCNTTLQADPQELPSDIKIRIMSTSRQAEAWKNAFEKMGLKDVKIVQEMERRSDESPERKPAAQLDPEDKNLILVLPNSFHQGYYKLIEDFINKGGKVIASQAAGYSDGQFYLTSALKAGKRPIAIPILYPNFLGYKSDKYQKISRWCINNGADGLAVFRYATIKGKKDPCQIAKESFDELEQSIKRRQNYPTLLGLPETPKILYVGGAALQTDSAEEIVECARSIGANVLNVVLMRRSLWLHYPSKYNFKPEPKTVSPEAFPKLVKACEKYGIQIWANITSQNAFPLDNKEEQAILDNGKTGAVCPLRGRKNYYPLLCEMIKELLQEYPYINAVILDEPGIRCFRKRSWGCFCPDCKDLFRKKYGKELNIDNIETAEATAFREEIVTNYIFKPIADAINQANPNCYFGFWAWPAYDLAGINVRSAVNAGVNILGPEYAFEMYSADGKDYMLDGENTDYLNPSKELQLNNQNFFTFNSLSDNSKNHPLLRSITFTKSERTGLVLDAFNGAEIIAWMTDGTNRHPGIITANDGRTVYFAFDPVQAGDVQLIGNALDFVLKNGKGKK